MTSSSDTLFQTNLAEHLQLFQQLSGLTPEINDAGRRIAAALAQGGKLMLCGNGGSAADAQHIASELTGRFIQERRPLAGIALTTDSSALTCIGNDYAFDEVFARQLRALGRAGDVLIGISTSGNSANVVKAVQAAREMGVTVIGLLGRDGGALKPLSDVAIVVPSKVTARIQEAHILIGHTLCGLIEHELGLA
ncbi:D-sedoheptulose 7-phosphate isomerase [Ideonella sp. B508-1]|uniref:D-sedoheptulose 7-phosphate isomerase n=1 Tax=Ideonella sp. B508-1 TaxID=137716 RepID=UPI0003462688|nr:D-sedoheptulose 7-phosphate isomerase [Ideonella sp. B508-1]